MTTPPAHRSLPVLAGTAKLWIPGVLTAVPIVIAALAGLEGAFYLVAAMVPAASLGFTLIAIMSNCYARRTGRLLEIASEGMGARHLPERISREYGLEESRVGEWMVFFVLQVVVLLACLGAFLYAGLAWLPHGFTDVDL